MNPDNPQDNLKKIYEKLDDINREVERDQCHSKKRIISFNLLDSFLDLCALNICPILEQEHHHYLIDISIEGYINQRAYYYSKDKSGKDDNDRYLMARAKVDHVFCCNMEPSLNEEIFNEDKNQINNKAGLSYEGARKRRAFWMHLAEQNNEREEHYLEACSFINIIKNNEFPICSGSSINKSTFWVEFLCANTHIANGLDLYASCYLKQPCSTKLEDTKPASRPTSTT